MQSGSITRRRFLKHGVAAGMMTAAGPLIVPAGVLGRNGEPGANGRIVLGGIGAGVMGRSLMRSFAGQQDVHIAAIADVDMRRAREVAHGLGAQAHQDYRQLLDRQDIDAVVIATPHHWHGLQTIHAAQAGKDIYCEKCFSLTIREGRLMADAVKTHGRILQTGTQQRSGEQEYQGCMLIRNGRIGKVKRVIAHHYLSPWLNGLSEKPVPDELDWDMWCGPVQPHPYNPLITADHEDVPWGGWYSFRAFGGGEMCCFGPHGLDIVQWALGMDEGGPAEVWTEGEPFAPVTFRESSLEGAPLSHCHHCHHSTGAEGLYPKVFVRYPGDTVVEFGANINSGAQFIGEKGRITISRNHLSSEPEELALEPLVAPETELYRSTHHHRDWLEGIKARRQPVAHAEIGHRSATVCHLGNIARWVSERTGETGQVLEWDAQQERFTNSAWGNHFLDRPRRKGYELPDRT
jgi:predicted dehydrogenase